LGWYKKKLKHHQALSECSGGLKLGLSGLIAIIIADANTRDAIEKFHTAARDVCGGGTTHHTFL
jgi:hypothetical protein